MYFTDEQWADWKIPISNSQVIDLMIEHEPKPYYKPNRRYNYSNTGYIILADIVERVSGMSFERFMKKKIFKPLGMHNSKVKRFKLGEEDEPVVGHSEYRFRRIGQTYLNGTVGDKGIYSTVEDMFKWDRAIKQGALVSLKTLDEAFQGYHKDLRKNDNYGYGWRINEVSKSKKVVYHRGWWKGFRTYFIRVLDEDKTHLGKRAITNYEVISRLNYVSLVKCVLETGRTHQIRVHMKHIGHTLFNDERYGGNLILKGTTFTKYKQFVENCFKVLPRQALHAKTLGFTHPKTGESLEFDSDLPEDFSSCIEKWEKYSNNN